MLIKSVNGYNKYFRMEEVPILAAVHSTTIAHHIPLEVEEVEDHPITFPVKEYSGKVFYLIVMC